LTLLDPGGGQLVSIERVEGTQVGDHTRRDQHISRQIYVDGAHLVRHLIPEGLLASETLNKLRSTDQLSLTISDVSLKLCFFIFTVLELVLEFSDFIHNFFELGLLDLQHCSHLSVCSLGNGQLSHLGSHDQVDLIEVLHGQNPTSQVCGNHVNLQQMLFVKLGQLCEWLESLNVLLVDIL